MGQEPPTSVEESKWTLDSGSVRIEFQVVDKRLVIASLEDKQGREWLGQWPQNASFWLLAVRGPESATVELRSADLAPTVLPQDSQASRGSSLRFAWEAALGGKAGLISLTVRSDPQTGLVLWSLDARLPEGWHVVRAEPLILPNLKIEAGLKMAAPVGWGLEYDVKPGMGYSGNYPSLVASSSFLGFYRERHGLYLGVHDPDGHHKHLGVKTDQTAARVTITHWPTEADSQGGHYAPAFACAIGGFKGDYLGAAAFYRAFVVRTPWGRGMTAGPYTPPEWLKDIDLWLMPEPEPLKNVEACKRAGEFFGVPIALHWYRWHEIPFDTLYPEYFPAKEHFKEGVRALQEAGFRVMPYINGRLCDPKSKTWTEEHADQSAARKEDGSFYTEIYGSKVPLNVMCPATKQWRDKVAGIVDRLFNEYGVDGVYIDQITAAAAMRCHATDHGHSPGGGTFWVNSYRTLLDDIRKKMPPGRILTSEENAECWNDQFDALLMVNTPADSNRRIVPLMPAVYADRVITFGFQYIVAGDIQNSLPFRAKMARAFIWGAQLGWVRVEAIMADDAKREAEFLRDLARCRRHGHEFFVGGEFLGELEVTGDNPPLKVEGGTISPNRYAVNLPAVLATAWRNQARAGVVAVNMSDQERLVTLKLPPALLPPAGQSLQGEILGPEGPLGPVEAKGELPVKLPPRSARLFRFTVGMN